MSSTFDDLSSLITYSHYTRVEQTTALQIRTKRRRQHKLSYALIDAAANKIIDDAADKIVDEEINNLNKMLGIKTIHTNQTNQASKSGKLAKYIPSKPRKRARKRQRMNNNNHNHNIKLKKDGSVDKRCKAYKNHYIRFKKDGNIDKRCKAYKKNKNVINIISDEDEDEETKELARALMISTQEAMYNNNNNNNNNNNTQPNVVVSLVEKRTYFCRICVPNKKYKSKKHYYKHMAQHNNNNNNNNNSNNKNNNNNNIRRSILGKRKQLDPCPPNTNIPPCPPRRKHKKCAIESSILTATKIKCDLDMVKLQTNSYLNNGECYVRYAGKPYRLRLYIDTAQQNKNVLQLAKQKGVYCEYKKLGNVDYIIVIAQDDNENTSEIYMLDFVVLVDARSRGKPQKERLKLTSIVRKYYIVEGKESLRTVRKKGYMVKYTKSKQETMNKICDHYYKLLYFFNHRNAGKELILRNEWGIAYSFQEFQESQKIMERNSVSKIKRNMIILD